MDKDIIKSVIKGGVIGTTIIKASAIVDKFIFTTCKTVIFNKGLRLAGLLVPNWFIALALLGLYVKIKYPYKKEVAKK